VGAWSYGRVTHRKPINSIAVLPLLNSTADGMSDYLSDGISEGVLNRLTAASQLRVIARASVFEFKGKHVDPRQVGIQLGVGAILLGSMTRSGDSVIVQADLVSVERGSEIWGHRYQTPLAALQDLEAEIALDVADKLKVQLVGNERRRLTKHHTNDGEADQLYMNGLYFLNRFWSSSTRMNEDLGQSRDCFHKALKRDPDFALAHLALAEIHDVEASLRLVSTEEAYTAARAECRRALAIDQNLAERTSC
jgi:TolB-like protein